VDFLYEIKVAAGILLIINLKLLLYNYYCVGS
jgi:hypothetical protein